MCARTRGAPAGVATDGPSDARGEADTGSAGGAKTAKLHEHTTKMPFGRGGIGKRVLIERSKTRRHSATTTAGPDSDERDQTPPLPRRRGQRRADTPPLSKRQTDTGGGSARRQTHLRPWGQTGQAWLAAAHMSRSASFWLKVQDPHSTARHRGTSAAPRLLVRPRCSGRAGGPERWRGTASSKF